MKVQYIFLAICQLLPATSFAIVNIETQRMDEDKLGWSSNFALTLDGKQGNTDKSALAIALGTQWVEDNARTLLIGALNYGTSDGVKDDEEYFAHLRHTHQFAPGLDWEVFTQKEYQPFTFNRKRSLYGGGIRLATQFYRFDGHAGMGLMHVDESATEADLSNHRTQADRLNLFSALKYPLSKTAHWIGVVYFQPQINHLSDYQASITTGINAEVIGPLQMTFDISYQYDVEPTASTLGHENLNYQFSMTVAF